jgi:hypothetical protein
MTRAAPMEHPGLAEEDVIAHGGWHPRYIRVLATASDGDQGFAVVDGNGDGAELEAELWLWEDGTWTAGSSSGAGPLDSLGLIQTGGQAGSTYFAYGRALERRSITVRFDQRLHEVPVSRHGVWAFIKTSADPGRSETPRLAE